MPIYLNGELKLHAGYVVKIKNDAVFRSLVINPTDMRYYTEYKGKLMSRYIYEMLKAVGLDRVKDVIAESDEGSSEECYINTDDGLLIGVMTGAWENKEGIIEFTFKFYTPQEYVEYLLAEKEKYEGKDISAGGAPSTLDQGIIIYSVSALLFGTFAVALAKKRTKA